MSSVFDRHDFSTRAYEFEKMEIKNLLTSDSGNKLSKEMADKYFWILTNCTTIELVLKKVLDNGSFNHCRVPCLRSTTTDFSAQSMTLYTSSLMAFIASTFPTLTQSDHLICSVAIGPLFNNSGFPGPLFWTFPALEFTSFNIEEVKTNVSITLTDLKTKVSKCTFKYFPMKIEGGTYNLKKLKVLISQIVEQDQGISHFLKETLNEYAAEYNLSHTKRRKVSFSKVSKDLTSVAYELFK